MNDTTSTAQLFLEIAKRHMPSVETLETRNRDALDFHDVAVWSIRNSLAEGQHMPEAQSPRQMMLVIPRLAKSSKAASKAARLPWISEITARRMDWACWL
jgi:hypothetical protein